MSKLLFTAFLASLAFAFITGKQREQQTEYTKQAQIDAQGNIYELGPGQADLDGRYQALF